MKPIKHTYVSEKPNFCYVKNENGVELIYSSYAFHLIVKAICFGLFLPHKNVYKKPFIGYWKIKYKK